MKINLGKRKDIRVFFLSIKGKGGFCYIVLGKRMKNFLLEKCDLNL